MPRLLKIGTSLFLALIVLFSTSATALAGPLLPALTSPEMNLEKYVIGEDAINPGGSGGMLSTLINGVVLLSMGARDENGNVLVQGATDHLSRFATIMYQSPPASSGQYLAYLNQRLKIVPQVYAQGKGASFLSPVVNLWAIVRNATYVFYIAIFVILGFMIMFRAKLNPQTVVGISNALPNIIISLILVTFSFAISGLIVDLAYLGNGLIENLFENKLLVPTTLGQPATESTWGTDATVFNLITDADLGGQLWNALDALINFGSGGGKAMVFSIVIALTIISTAFKIFFNLLTKYISLFLITLLSPLAVFATGFTGFGGAMNFFKQLLAAALTFPATYFMINLSFYFSKFASRTIVNFSDITPFKLHTFVQVANQEQIAIATVSGLIALGVLMAAAQIPQVIDQALNVKPVIGGGAGEQMSGAVRKIPIIGGFIG